MGAPSFSGRGGQDRARGCHLTAANTLSAFWPIQPQWGGGGGGSVHFRLIQPVGEGCCLISANSASRGCACM